MGLAQFDRASGSLGTEYTRGSQYVAKEYKKATENMQRSYSKKAFPWDNACIESFHSIIKREWLNRFKIRDYKQVNIAMKRSFTVKQ